jgi:hypothetical protein
VAQVTSKLLSEEGIPLMAYLFTYDDFKKSDQHMSNPYGLLRAPWNYNPSEYLTRFNNLNGLDTTALPMATKFKMYYGSNCAALKNFFTLFTVVRAKPRGGRVARAWRLPCQWISRP